MTKRYETTRSLDEPRLMLISPEGTWESLPFEIRLLRRWYGMEICDRSNLTAAQRFEIEMHGYSIAHLGC